MVVYLLKVIACSGLFYAFYYCFLQKEKMLVFNRFYLLGSLLVSFLIPLSVIQIRPKPGILRSADITTVSAAANAAEGATFAEALIPFVCWAIGIISSVLLLRFVIHLFQISRKIKGNEQRIFEDARLVLLPEPVMPHSFFKYVFLNKPDFEHNRIEAAILVHELSHVRQKHTWDVVLVEFIGALMWFNPFFLLYRRAIRLNHEFLADQAGAGGKEQPGAYQQLLLKSIYVNQSIPLASSFYFSTTKKRLLMLQRKTSFFTAVGKAAMVLPLTGGLVFLFAARTYAQQEKPVITSTTVTEVRRDSRQSGDVESLTVTTSKDKKQRTAELKYKNGMVIREDISTKERAKAFEKKYGVINPPPPPPPYPPQELKMRNDIESLKVVTPGGRPTVVVEYKTGEKVRTDISSPKKKVAFEQSYGVKIPPPPPPSGKLPRPTTMIIDEHKMKTGDINSAAPVSTLRPERIPGGIHSPVQPVPPVLVKERVAPGRSAGVALSVPARSAGESRVLETKMR